VERRLTVANGATSVTFSSSAMDLVFAATGGVPRVINLLCDRALMSGARKQVTEITPAIVKEAANSLLLTAPESGVARFLKPRWLALLGALLVLAVVAALVPADWFTDMTLPRLPGTPPKPVAAAATALAPPTADLLLPPPILPPPTPRRVPRPDTDAAPPVSP
jgi:general secretion pathway protein A